MAVPVRWLRRRRTYPLRRWRTSCSPLWDSAVAAQGCRAAHRSGGGEHDTSVGPGSLQRGGVGMPPSSTPADGLADAPTPVGRSTSHALVCCTHGVSRVVVGGRGSATDARGAAVWASWLA